MNRKFWVGTIGMLVATGCAFDRGGWSESKDDSTGTGGTGLVFESGGDTDTENTGGRGGAGATDNTDESCQTSISSKSEFTTIPNGSTTQEPSPAACLTIEVPESDCKTIVDIDVSLAITHDQVGDLVATIERPNQPPVRLFNRPNHSIKNTTQDHTQGYHANLDAAYPVWLDDAASIDAESIGAGLTTDDTICSNSQTSCRFQPTAIDSPTLSHFNNQPAAGIWTICVHDRIADTPTDTTGGGNGTNPQEKPGTFEGATLHITTK